MVTKRQLPSLGDDFLPTIPELPTQLRELLDQGRLGGPRLVFPPPRVVGGSAVKVADTASVEDEHRQTVTKIESLTNRTYIVLDDSESEPQEPLKKKKKVSKPLPTPPPSKTPNPQPSKTLNVSRNPKCLKASKAVKVFKPPKNSLRHHGKYRHGVVQDAQEKIVKTIKPANDNYVYVPKGDVYITRNCTKFSKEKGHIVNIVVPQKQCGRIGIQVPKEIFDFVSKMNEVTRPKRLSVINRRETRIITLATKCMSGMFKNIPAGMDTEIIQSAFEKFSRAIGRTETKSLPARLRLATITYIRNKFTNYPSRAKKWSTSHNGRKLPGDISEQFQDAVWDDIKRVWNEWGPTEPISATLNKKVWQDYVAEEEEDEMDFDVESDAGDTWDEDDGEDEDETDEDEEDEEDETYREEGGRTSSRKWKATNRRKG
ncbi:hypothetical protein RUND412_000569 [Rhizina undulata]